MSHYKMAEHSSTAFQAMNERRKCGELCDFEIKIQGQTFPVHRIVLDSCSEYFRTMFASKLQESNEGFCEVRDVDANVVEICIEFMYTGHLDITVDTAINVLSLAHMWHLNKAVKQCEDLLHRNLNATRCFSYRRLASLYNLKRLLLACNEFIFTKTEAVQYSAEVENINLTEMEALLKAWKEYSDKKRNETCSTTEPYYRGLISEGLKESKQSDLKFWNFCNIWGQYESNSSQFCQIMEHFPIEKLLVQDFIEVAMEENHTKECKKCEDSLRKRFLDGIDSDNEISKDNCLILKDLANRYNCESMKQRLTHYIVDNYKAVFASWNFNKLVPPDDFIVYMERVKCWQISLAKLSTTASWIRFSPDREIVFPKLFTERRLTKMNENLADWFGFYIGDKGNVFKPENVFFFKTLSQKYSCHQVEKETDDFIARNFSSILKLPASMQLLSKDLILYLQNSVTYRKSSTEVWNFILKWINHDPTQRKGEFPAIFQALNLKHFHFIFIREKIRTHDLVKESNECMSHLLDFTMHEMEKLHKETDVIKKLDKRIEKLERIEAGVPLSSDYDSSA